MKCDVANMYFSPWKVHICHLRHVTKPEIKPKNTVDAKAKSDKKMVLVQYFKQV